MGREAQARCRLFLTGGGRCLIGPIVQAGRRARSDRLDGWDGSDAAAGAARSFPVSVNPRDPWFILGKSSFASREHGVPGSILDFAALGFVAVTINYRLSGEARFPAALEDCKNAVRWLRAYAKNYNLDPDFIGAYGNSASGGNEEDAVGQLFTVLDGAPR